MFGATLLTAFGWLAATMPAQAQVTTWTGATSSDWFTAGNWSAGIPTNAADTVATIDTVTPNAAVVGTAGAQANSLIVGFAGTGMLTIQGGGTLTNTSGLMALSASSTGTVTVDGAGSLWNSAGVFVGQSGNGTLTIRNGGAVTATSSVIAIAPGSTGTATVDGTGSSWTNSLLIVSNGGGATLTVRNGGTVISDSGSIGAGFSTGTGSVTVDGTGSSWAAGQLLVGNGGGATLTVQNGGAVTSTSAFVGNGGPTANATVDGAGSSWANAGMFVVGSAGSGALTIRNGGTASSTMAAVIGVGSTAAGTVTVDGTGSSWTIASNLSVGSASNGTGTLTIRNGGTVRNTDGSIGDALHGSGTVTVDGTGSSWANSGSLVVGNFDTGTLTIRNGGAVSNTNADIGNFPDATGTVTVDGTGSSWTNTGLLTVGDQGRGALTVSNGAAVSSTGGFIGGFTGSTGTVTVDGTGSSWANAGTLVVGNRGSGTLTIRNGGAVSNTDGAIGNSSGPTGTVTVDGTGSSWTNAGTLVVGNNGSGTLTITNGGTVSNTDGSVGSVGSTGTVTVDGSGSSWANTGVLAVGNGGGGTLTIRNGATVSAASVGIAGASAGTLNIGAAAGATAAAPGTLNTPIVVLQASTDRIVFNHTATNYAFTAAISGAGTVMVEAGTTVLTANNTYTGPTTVDGRLIVNGSIASGLTTVNSGGTLGGGGIITGTVIVDGTLAAGSSPGTLTIGTLALNAGSTSIFELNAPGVVGGVSNDLVIVTNGLTLGGALQAQAAAGGYYRLFGYGGTLSGGFASTSATGTGGFVVASHQVQVGIPGQVNLAVRGAGQTLQFWDGADSIGNGTVDGGAGTWSSAGTNWTGQPGQAGINGPWEGSVAVFAGAAGGGVSVAGTQAVDTLQFSTSGYVLGGGTLALSPASGTAGTITVDSGITATIGSTIADGTGSGLNKIGGGTLILTGANTYTGGTTISAGTLSISADTNLGDLSGGLTFNGGTLQNTAAITMTRAVTLNAGGGTFQTDANLEVGGDIGGSGGLTKSGAATLTLSGSNTYAGPTTITDGTLLAATSTALSPLSAITVIAGGALQILDGSVSAGAGSLAGDGSVVIGTGSGLAVGLNDQSTTFSGAISGSGSFEKTGAGTLTLTGTSSIGGVLSVCCGTLDIHGGSFTAGATAVSGTLTLSNGGRLQTGDLLDSGTLLVTGPGSIATASGDTVIGAFNQATAAIGSGGKLESLGDAFIGMGSTTTVTGTGSAWTIAGGLGIGHPVGGPGTLTVADGAAVTVIAVTTIDPTGTLNLGNGSLAGSIAASQIINDGRIVANFTDALTLAMPIDGAGSLAKTGAGTLILTADNTYTGGTTITAGRLQLGNGGTAGSIAGDVVNNGILAFNRSDTVTFAGAISGSGTVEKTGAGTLTLTGINSYGGGTTISAGTLVGNAAAFGTGGIVNNAALVVDQVAAGTLSNAISGSGTVEKTGAGTLTLTGINSYGGGTTISAGTLMGSAAAFGTGGIVNNAALVVDQATAGILSNAISGSGTVEKTGAGTLTLTGINSYGGATTISAGTLQLGNGGTTGSIIGDVLNNGTLAFNRADTVTFAAIISGTGAVQQNGAGTTVLTGINTYGGGTTISAGTLQLGNGGTTGSITGDVLNNGTLAFNRADTVTFAGIVSGTGAVQQNGAGTTVLTGINTYGGGTTISAGTLQLGNGGTTGSITGDVLNNGTLAFNRSDTVTFAGIISGTGAVQQNGAGTTVLTGTSTYAGPTSVNAGNLIVNGAIASTVTVNSGGLLGGSGTVGGIAANAGSTVSPGNSPGTLNVAGNVAFAAGSTYLVEIDAANNADRIAATGTATLSGGTVQVTKAGGGYVAGARYTILTANGSVNGTFAGLVAAGSGLPLFDLALSYDPNNVYLDVVRNAVTFCGVAATRSQCAVGASVESLGAGNAVFDAIANLPDTASVRRAFDLLSGEIHASAASTMVEQSQYLRDTVIGRVRQAYGVAGPAAALAPEGKVMAFAGTPPGVVADATPADAAARLFAQAPAAPPAGDAVIAAWTQGIGAWGKRSGDGNAGTLSRSLGGFLIGVDATIERTWRVGLAAGYTRASFDVDSRASSGNSDNYYVALYGGGQLGALGLRAGASFTWHDIGTTRRVAFAGVTDRLKANYNARTTQVFGEAGYAIALERVAFEPFAGLAWVNYRSDRINESGGAAALTGRRQAFDMGFSTLGLRAAATVTAPSDTTTVTLRGTLGWRHAFGDVTPEQRLAFRAGGSPFTAVGVPIARDSLIVEAGVDIDVTNYARFGFVYSGQFARNAQDHAIKGSLTLRF